MQASLNLEAVHSTLEGVDRHGILRPLQRVELVEHLFVFAVHVVVDARGVVVTLVDETGNQRLGANVILRRVERAWAILRRIVARQRSEVGNGHGTSVRLSSGLESFQLCG